jgi:hypothetical protein
VEIQARPEEAKSRRFKITLKSGGVLLHSAPSGLTRQEAIALSKDCREEIVECVPCPPTECDRRGKSVGDILVEACQDTGLDPSTFRALLSDDDLDDIAAGEIPLQTLRAHAKNFAKKTICPTSCRSGALWRLPALPADKPSPHR